MANPTALCMHCSGSVESVIPQRELQIEQSNVDAVTGPLYGRPDVDLSPDVDAHVGGLKRKGTGEVGERRGVEPPTHRLRVCPGQLSPVVSPLFEMSVCSVVPVLALLPGSRCVDRLFALFVEHAGVAVTLVVNQSVASSLPGSLTVPRR